MSKIVVTTLGSLGDLHPQIAIAIELQKRGHQIVFATHPEYQARIETVGLKFHPMRPHNPVDDYQAAAKMMDLRTGSEYIVRQWLLPSLRETYTDLLASAKDADFIVSGGGVFATTLVAEKLGIEWALSALAPVGFFSAYDPSVIPIFPFLDKLGGLGFGFNRGIMQLLKIATKSWAEPIHQLRRELGLMPMNLPLMEINNSPYLVLAMFSSVLAKPQLDWPKNTVMTGFTFYDDLQAGVALTPKLEQFLAGGEAPIVFTLGSAAVLTPGTFYRESIQATKLLNRRAVLLIGNNAPHEDLTDKIIAVDYVPYSQIFPRACAIVHQGGIGTTAQALRSGHPTLIMPYSHDQPDNAARVERLGTSRTISRNQYSAARVAKELRQLLDNPQYAATSAEIGQILQRENGVSGACDAIEQQLGSRDRSDG
jgi:rhamnosyltransferase subunit B